jgi:hypothetical protein
MGKIILCAPLGTDVSPATCLARLLIRRTNGRRDNHKAEHLGLDEADSMPYNRVTKADSAAIDLLE